DDEAMPVIRWNASPTRIAAPPVERVIQRRTAHAQIAGNDRLRNPAPDPLTGGSDLLNRQLRSPRIHPLALGDRDALGLALPDRGPLQLSDGSKDRLHELALRRVRI